MSHTISMQTPEHMQQPAHHRRRSWPAGLSTLVSVIVGLLALPATAAPDVNALMQAADRARGGGLPGIVWTIDLHSRDGEDEQRRSLRVTADGRSNDSVAEFTAPQKVNGQKLLMRGRNFWFIRPGLSRPVPISPRQRLLGEVSNGDIAATNYAGDYAARWLRSETLNGEPCEVLELHASTAGVTYDRILYWVSVQRQVGVRAEFYSVSGKLIKTADFEYDAQISWQGRRQAFVSRMLIRDALRSDEVSELRYRDIKVGEVDAGLFRLQ